VSELEDEAARLATERDRTLTPEDRRAHGVVHTPPELARFAVREVDRALGGGLDRATVLDPACGPGAFLAAVLAYREPRALVGLDRDEAAIVQARALLGDSARLVVGDTLASLDPLTERERDAPLVILGNPPWAGKSENRGQALMENLLADFRDGVRGERKIGVLSDAYVRFWRWSCELARRAREGAVVALYTNASFLDGPVHRGMRAALARWFARIDVYDLGGSALVARRGDADENVFGVRPSVALTIATRPRDHDERGCALRHVAIRGTRAQKLAALERGPTLVAIDPNERWTAFTRAPDAYTSWVSLEDVFRFHREGVQTNRDELCIDTDRGRLIERLRVFADGGPGPGVASAHYDPAAARDAIRHAMWIDPELKEMVVRVAYRPLDVDHRSRSSPCAKIAASGPGRTSRSRATRSTTASSVRARRAGRARSRRTMPTAARTSIRTRSASPIRSTPRVT
jgi:predicted RNA methylase